MIGRALIVAAGATLLSLTLAASASAHAVLERTAPSQGSDLRAQPAQVAFYFDEPVEASFEAVRVYDSTGEQVQGGEVFRPGGESSAIAVHLDSDLPDGSYTATYRVVSADSHPVSGGFVFSIGAPGPRGESVESLLSANSSGKVTSTAFWADRWLGYLAIALGAGGALFLFAVWRPALLASAGGDRDWVGAGEAFLARAGALLGVAAVIGVLASLVAIPLEGASAGGISFWRALEPSNLSRVLDTRFGTLMAVRAGAWLCFGAVLAAALARRRLPSLRLAELGATGVAPNRLSPTLALIGAVALAAIVATPALAGHASTQSPTAVVFPADLVHLLAMSVWIGGLALLVFALPAATRPLEPTQRTELLLANLSRFSRYALAAVIALAVTGTVQAVIEVGSFGALIDTGFGRAVLIKAVLLVVLIGFGAANRQRLIPALRRLAGERRTPGRIGVALRRNLRLEVALVTVVLAVAAALVSYAPASESATGPVSGRTTVGPAVLEYTVDPAAVGQNQLHLYLFDAEDGSQYRAAREVSAQITDPAAEIGPLDVELRRAGPGHYVASRAGFGVADDWTVEVTVRTSRFSEDSAEFEVPIR